MSGTVSSGDGTPAGALATARVAIRRRPSVIWLVPLVALLIAGWLAWDTLSKRGPTITVTFESAEGLVAGQSQVKYKDVVMGMVKSFTLSPDLTHVIVTAQMKPEAAALLTSRARFWVVKPRLFAGSISGLETVLSGAYIALLPSTEKAPAAHDFKGLEDPPVMQSDVPGHTFLLKAERLGSISAGSPVFYRGLDVGEVLGWDIADMAESVTLHAFVRSPFDQYVHEETHFWNVSGVSLDLGAEGVRLRVESLRALLLGGIAFDTPPHPHTPMVTAQDAVFPLYDDKLAADAAGYTRRIELLAYFPGAVDGLAKGAPVTLRGIRIGQVTSVRLEYDRQSDTLRVPVRFEVQPQRVADSDEVAPRGPLDNIRRLVAQGLRAQLNTVSLLTGQKGIEFAMVADAPPAEVTIVDGDIIMPTAPDQFGSIVELVNALVAKLSKLPFERIGANLDATLAGVNDMVNGAPLRQTLVALQGTMNAAREVMTALAGSSGPAIRRLPQIAADLQELDDARQPAAAEPRYRLWRQLEVQPRPQPPDGAGSNDAAQAIRVLSDVLTRHPEALIRGRPDLGGGK